MGTTNNQLKMFLLETLDLREFILNAVYHSPELADDIGYELGDGFPLLDEWAEYTDDEFEQERQKIQAARKMLVAISKSEDINV